MNKSVGYVPDKPVQRHKIIMKRKPEHENVAPDIAAYRICEIIEVFNQFDVSYRPNYLNNREKQKFECNYDNVYKLLDKEKTVIDSDIAYSSHQMRMANSHSYMIFKSVIHTWGVCSPYIFPKV